MEIAGPTIKSDPPGPNISETSERERESMELTEAPPALELLPTRQIRRQETRLMGEA